MQIRLWLILGILFIQTAAFANVFEKEQSLKTIVPKLPELKSTNCKFTQDKYVPASNLHLKSSGNFTFVKDKGATFYVTYPVKTVISYSSGEYKQINNIINAIANKNYSRLEHDFKFYFAQNNAGWDFGLKPKKNSKISNFLSSIEISGKTDISKIVIIMTDETKTVINFIR